MNLNDIHSPKDIKNLDLSQLKELSAQLRDSLLTKLSRHGGHIGPNLGVVELTVALHRVFDAPKDKLVFDVSHQSYVHKMLTGRIEAFTVPAHYDDVTGYTCPRESEYDLFEIGHTSTSVSLATGLAKARDLQGGNENVIAIIGDGSLSGGEAFEGLDFGAELGSNFIVVVNDNDMSIAENHGGLYENLRQLRETDGKCETNYFRSLGYDYRFVPYGNDIESLIAALTEVKGIDHPIVVHVATQKGKGYAPAEEHREQFHYGAPFDIPTGNPLNISQRANYADIFADYMLDRMKKDNTVVTITAGTPSVIGFTPDRRIEAGRQFVDVGIAEEQAVAMLSGLAKGGAKPVFGVASTFIQRAYDQISQDLCINSNPGVITIFYGSVFGMNDMTHLGFFDISLLSNIPNLVYLAPTCKEEYIAMLGWAIDQNEHPVVVRVPDMAVIETNREYPTDYSDLNKNVVERKGSRIAIIGVGSFLPLASQATDILATKGIEATLINPRFLSGLDTDLLTSLLDDHETVITLEDGIIDGGYGQKVASFYGNTNMKVLNRGLRKKFLDRYNANEIVTECHLTPELIAADAIATLG